MRYLYLKTQKVFTSFFLSLLLTGCLPPEEQSILAPPLTKRDYLTVVWPSSAPRKAEGGLIEPQKLAGDIDAICKQYGLGGALCSLDTVSPPPFPQDAYANTNAERARALVQAWNDPATRGILAGRGGFGARPVVSQLLEKGSLPPRWMPMVGFSDFTYLAAYLLRHHYPCYHGPMASFNREMTERGYMPVNAETSLKEVIDIFTQGNVIKRYELAWLNADTHAQTPIGVPLETTILGGNCAIVQRIAGGPLALEGKGAIIFLEETGEHYRRAVDYVTSLIENDGKRCFGEAVAIFLGDFGFDKDPEKNMLCITMLAAEIERLLQRVLGIRLPILYSPHFGHGKVNHVLPLGTKATLMLQSPGKAYIHVATKDSYWFS